MKLRKAKRVMAAAMISVMALSLELVAEKVMILHQRKNQQRKKKLQR